MNSATRKLFLALGDAKSLRTAEISNWTGKAIAAAVIHGGTANGLIEWKSTTGTTRKQLDENS